jgi:hypothetical protein
MMVLSALRPDASLVEFLAHRARSAPVARLAAEAIAGFAVAGAAWWWNPRAQLFIASCATSFFCYAMWGLLDRARSVSIARTRNLAARILNVACALFVAIGVVAGAGVLLSIWALALGTWIS